jgi:hypothetical protein
MILDLAGQPRPPMPRRTLVPAAAGPAEQAAEKVQVSSVLRAQAGLQAPDGLSH